MLRHLLTRYSKIKPFLSLLPFFVFYCILVILLNDKELQGDETRYIEFANNLMKGFYSPPPPFVDLRNGPGYPLLLTPFIAINAPMVFIKLLNAIFLYLSLVFSFKSLINYLSSEKTLLTIFLLFLYFPVVATLPSVLTESLSIFLISLICYSAIKLTVSKKFKFGYVLLTSFAFAYLALTKIIFGYLIIVSIISLLILIIIKNTTKRRKLFYSVVIAFFFCLPYLVYTYSLTGRILYWGSAGGESLYWMSSPYDGEYGDWMPIRVFREEAWKEKDNIIPCYYDEFYENHHEIYEKTKQMATYESDSIFYQEAIKNIKEHPEAYLKNWLLNISRMLFSYPYSYRRMTPRTLFYILPNMFLVVIGILSFILYFKVRKQVPFEITALLLFALIYIFGSSLVTAVARLSYIISPIIFIWIAFMLGRFVTIKVRKKG